MNTTLQISFPKELETSSLATVKKYGFSSLQELIHVLLAKLAKSELDIKVEKIVRLSAKNEKRYLKMERDFKVGKNIHIANSVEDLMRQLTS